MSKNWNKILRKADAHIVIHIADGSVYCDTKITDISSLLELIDELGRVRTELKRNTHVNSRKQ